MELGFANFLHWEMGFEALGVRFCYFKNGKPLLGMGV